MKFNSILTYFNTVLIVLLIIVSLYLNHNKQTFAYVKTGVIIEKYQGMIDARKALEKKAAIWENNLDTLRNNFEKTLIDYNNGKSRLTQSEKKTAAIILEQKRNVFEKYSLEIQQKAESEELKETQAALNQVNSYIEQYGKSHKYDLIVSATSNGNLLYGNKELDITEEVLNNLNKNYFSEK